MGPTFWLLCSTMLRSRFAGVTWGFVDAGDTVGRCLFITVVTMEELELTMAVVGGGASLGGVTMKEAEADKGGSSKLSSGSGRRTGQMEQQEERK